MKTIYKYQLDFAENIIKVPTGSTTLSVQVQNNKICVWVMVETTQEEGEKKFDIYGTGHPVDNLFARKFIGTVQLADGTLVFHVFERTDWR